MIDDLIGEINRILSFLVCPGFCQKQQEKLFFSSYFMNNKKRKKNISIQRELPNQQQPILQLSYRPL